MTLRAAATVLGTLASSVARADEPPPDPAVSEAAGANLEPRGVRDNVVVTLAVGPSFSLGFGIADAVGRGGSASLRLGKVATARWLVTLEAGSFAVLHRFADRTYTNSEGTVQVGGQYYVRQRGWLRFAGGAGVYRAIMVALEGGGRGDQRLAGLAGTVGAGLDFKRWGRVILDVELASTMLLTRDGALVSSGLYFGASID